MRSLQLIAVFALALTFCSGSIILKKTVKKEGYACDIEDDGKVFPSKDNCNAYYLCKHQEVLIKYCDEYERFDAYKLKCVYDQSCNSGGYGKDESHGHAVHEPAGYGGQDDPKHAPGYVESHDPHAVHDPHASHDPHAVHDPHASHDPHAVHDPHAPKKEHKNPCYSKDFIAISHVCFAYFKCVGYEAVYKECPKGERFDVKYGYCVPDKSCFTACPKHITPNPKSDASFFLGDELTYCPYGTFFDYRICTCDHYYNKSFHSHNY